MNSINIKLPNAEQLPSGRWRARVQVGDFRKSFLADSKEEAVRLATIYKLSTSNNKELILKANEMLTISEAIDGYIAERNKILSPSTIKGYKSIKNHRFQSIMDNKLADNINWQAVINKESEEVSAKTLKNSWGLISSVLNEHGIETGNVRIPQIIRSEHKFFQPDEIKKFVNVVDGHRFETAYLLCLHGLRRSEAFAVKKSDIRDGYIFVQGSQVYDENGEAVIRKENKTVRSNRKVPVMIPRLERLAKECTTEFVCAYKMNSIFYPLNTLCRNNDLPEIGLHGLRHSFASLCYHLGISEMQCMEFGGWSDINVMRKIYTHLADCDKVEAEAKLKMFFA